MQQITKMSSCWIKEYLKINVVGFCRGYWRGEDRESTGLNPTGLQPLLVQAEVMRTLTVLDVRMEKEHPWAALCMEEAQLFIGCAGEGKRS